MLMFKVFPAWLTPDKQKVPLIKNWQNLATNDPNQIKLWMELYKERISFWGIPCGQTNGIFALDIDTKKANGWESLKNLGYQIPETLRQDTPSGGSHFLFKTQPGLHYPNTVNSKLGLDTRGDGGWIAFYGFKNNLPPVDSPEWMFRLSPTLNKTPQQVQGTAIRVSPEIAQGIIQTSLDNVRNAPEGESNNALNVEAFRVGQLVTSGSITRQYAEEALLRAALDRGKPVYESKCTIASGLDGGNKKPLTSPFGDSEPKLVFPIPPPPETLRWTPNYFTTHDLMNTSKLRKPQLFQDWSTEDIHITTADGGTGKTTLKLFEAVCLALGERFLGFDCKQPGKTLFITGEDSEKKLGAIIGAIIRQMGLFENVPGNHEKIETIKASIVVKKDSDLCLIQKTKEGFLHLNSDALRKVLEAIGDIKPKMIVFDPISSFWGSEAALNDMNKAVIKFMSELVDHSDACVEMINHAGKKSSQDKDMSQFSGRGGTGLPSNARVSRALISVFEDEYLELTGESLGEKQSAMMCNVNKFSDGSPLYNKKFLILRDGFLFTRKILTPQKARDLEKSFTDVERVFTFIKEARLKNKYPTKPVIVCNFMTSGDPISEARVKRALDQIQYSGNMGEHIKAVNNPDESNREKVYVITDPDGRET
jgi:RecA-family ATPase